MTSVSLGGPSAAALAQARWRLAGLAVVLTGLGLSVLAALALNARELGDQLDVFGPATVGVLALMGAVLVVAMIPASLVAGAAGYAVGTAAGTPAALVGVTGGAVVCALLGRYVGTPAARYALGGRVTRMVSWVEARPVRAVMTSRLVPGLPFNATSYVLGFTRIGMRDVALGTGVGFAPRCFAYVALGGSLRDLGSAEARIAMAVSVLLAVLVIVVPRLVVRDAVSAAVRSGGEGSDG
jgi:uncharacterized membrane protein YdjX (TVP38/TMEM64 family)